MDLRQLRSFISVAQQNGFRRGASSLNIAQPAVSRHIKQLEASLKVELFHRTSGGAKLTEAGAVLLRHAEGVFEQLTQIRNELSEMSQRVIGTVRVGAPSSIGDILFAPLAHRVRQLAPDIRLTFTESSCRLLGLLETGHIDLAVQSCTHELNKADWVCRKLVGERVYLIGKADALRGVPSLDIESVITKPLILTPLPNAQHQYLFDVARQYGRKLNIMAEAESMTGLMALIDRGLGLGVLPFSAATMAAHGHAVSTSEIRGFFSWRTLIRRADWSPSPAGQKIWDVIISETQALSATGIFGPPVEADQPPFGAPPPALVGGKHSLKHASA
ncbi:MAG TPA: LysR family transcriptional regulator [Pseudolabrys sp.]|nr:LysR family transcriptional regulator [Pseudolabrys sp.]